MQSDYNCLLGHVELPFMFFFFLFSFVSFAANAGFICQFYVRSSVLHTQIQVFIGLFEMARKFDAILLYSPCFFFILFLLFVLLHRSWLNGARTRSSARKSIKRTHCRALSWDSLWYTLFLPSAHLKTVMNSTIRLRLCRVPNTRCEKKKKKKKKLN